MKSLKDTLVSESDRTWIRLDIKGGIERVQKFSPWLSEEQAHAVFYYIDKQIQIEIGAVPACECCADSRKQQKSVDLS
jgi:hypothetical protein